METKSWDVAVIGAGTAGLAAYRAARAAGKRAVLIEAGDFGTTCARIGCMPSKLLLAAANGLHDAKALAPRGIEGTDALAANGAQVLDYVRRERDHFVAGVLEEMETFPKETIVRGRAKFEAGPAGRHVLSIDDTTRIEAASVVIATGASPSVPDDFKVFGDALITSDALFELRALPQRVAVFGAGPIALELGQALARLGVRVHMFGKGGDVGGLSDTPVRDELAAALAEEFYFDPDAPVHAMSLDNGVPTVRFTARDGTERTEQFDTVLVATGRAPALKSLGLDAAGIALNENGVPRFDETSMQCGDSSIFIAGDCDGTRPWLSDASDEGKLAGDNAAKFPDVTHVERKVPFSLVFCEPQVTMIGTPYDNLDRQMTVTGAASFETQGRSRVMRQNRGLLHVYAEAKTGKLLGAEGCGPAVEHLGHLLAWALQLKMTVDETLRLPFYHPVVEEGLRTALKDASRKCREQRSESFEDLPGAPGC